MTRSSWLAGALAAGLFLALHLPFLPPALEDLDSINFALGVRDFDVARHQPHPPGYPVFIAAAKILHATGLSEVHALSLLSVLAGAVAIFGLLLLFGELDRDTPSRTSTWMAVLLVAACPLYWLTALRPLSDAAGLAAVLVIEGLTVAAASTSALTVAAALAGLAAGIRIQVVWLTLPLLLLAVVRLPRVVRRRGLLGAFAGYAAGVVVWFIPLIVVSGGPSAYAAAFFNQGAEDLSGVAMLATTPSIRLLAQTLQHSFLDPWGYWQLGVAVLLLATAGAAVVLIRSRSVALTLAAAFGPYLAFHLLFQEAVTTRYALPLVVPVVYLAVRGVNLFPRSVAMAAAIALGVTASVVDDGAMFGYGRMSAPAFRLLGDMAAAPRLPTGAPVLAMHRREDFDLRRPIQWMGDAMPAMSKRLPTPPKHEWLELVKYWNDGGRDPVWFVADPLRSDLALIGRDSRPSLYRWPFPFTMLVGGARPNEMDWHTIASPDWYLGEGWSVTPETAGTAREDRRGPGYAPIDGWVRRWPDPVTLVVGGRNLSTSGASASLRVQLDGQLIEQATIPPGFFLRMLRIPSVAGAGDYAHLAIDADSVDLAIEQFDAKPAGRLVYGFGDGWNELEYAPLTGDMWRWSSDRSVIRVRPEGHGVALTLRGSIEAASSSHVTIRAGDRVAAAFDVGRTFSRTVVIPATFFGDGENVITIESAAWYVPADSRWRSADRRKLGLKLYECRLTPAS